jgi:glycosyltransferase involved in cell wall biosynthesis
VASRPSVLLTFLAWAGAGLSGGDRHLLEVAARWREQVDVAVLAPPGMERFARSFLGDVPIQELGASGRARSALGPLLALEYSKRSVVASIRTLPHADVVVAASHFTPDAAALRTLVRRGALGVGYVYHLVSGRPGCGPRTLWSKTDERIGLALLRRFAGVVFVPNEPTARELGRRGIDPVRTAVGIDVAAFRQTALAGRRQAAFLARMVHTKGVQDAVRAWAAVRRAVPDARLVMMGSGPEAAAGAALAERLGIADAIEWRGFVFDDEKREVLGSSRLLLAPSYEEGWGISVCEALASGVPVVAYRLPALDELFDSAYLGADPGDVDGLAEHATRVLTDDAVAGSLAQRGIAAVAQYDVARVAETELEVILARLART